MAYTALFYPYLRGHQLPKKGVRILKSVEFTLISLISRDFIDFKIFQEISRDFIDFMGFHQQKSNHHLANNYKVIHQQNNNHLLILHSVYYSVTKIRTTSFLIDN